MKAGFSIAVAPMLDCTDRHARYFLRLISPHIKLYTEMITAPALIYGDYKKLLAYDPMEKYLALQLGGADPKQLHDAAKLGEDFGYDEINLNVGCPSSRVKAGEFGACLMLKPELVAECIARMCASVAIPVTVKCRIGVDQVDSYADLYHFIQCIAQAGCHTFIIHARKAWLSGLSPKENRTVPPLRYDVVYQIVQDFPQLNIILNGGIQSLTDVIAQEGNVAGVMIGRAAYNNPYLLAEIEQYYQKTLPLPRAMIIDQYLPYVARQLHNHVKLTAITRHLLGLFSYQTGARQWRRYLSEHAYQANAGIEVIAAALQHVLLTH